MYSWREPRMRISEGGDRTAWLWTCDSGPAGHHRSRIQDPGWLWQWASRASQIQDPGSKILQE